MFLKSIMLFEINIKIDSAANSDIKYVKYAYLYRFSRVFFTLLHHFEKSFKILFLIIYLKSFTFSSVKQSRCEYQNLSKRCVFTYIFTYQPV